MMGGATHQGPGEIVNVDHGWLLNGLNSLLCTKAARQVGSKTSIATQHIIAVVMDRQQLENARRLTVL